MCSCQVQRRLWGKCGTTLVLLCLCMNARLSAADNNPTSMSKQLFERVFGEAARLDAEMIARTRASKPGEYLLMGGDVAGKHDQAWFIDTAARHTADVRPLLVRAIDEDGDLDRDGKPDLDSDLYIADWKADGTVDAVIDYQDNDGDNDVDEMVIYQFLPRHRYFGKNLLMAWWGRDDGDDNQLWYDVNYAYDQARCQYRCHFSGDETFVAFAMGIDSETWAAAWENPFLFYDLDADGCSEVTMRIEGRAHGTWALRYSFDADDDAVARRTYDYDFSITAVAPENALLQASLDMTERTKLRGLPTEPWLSKQAAPAFVSSATWAQSLLTWDEMNANTEGDVARDPHERWEGIIARGSRGFPQVGGPACSALNKRNELCSEPKASLELYFHPADRRIHLKGAREGWLDVDYDLDGKVDAKYIWQDKDNDGLFDQCAVDVDGSGQPAFIRPMRPADARPVGVAFEALKNCNIPAIEDTLNQSQQFIDAAKGALNLDTDQAEPAESFFVNQVEAWMPKTGLGAYMRKSPAGARLYMELVRDRLFARLGSKFGSEQVWPGVQEAYLAGDYSTAARKVTQRWPSSHDAKRFGSFTRRIPITIKNDLEAPRFDWPIVIPCAELSKAAADFNPANCAVVAPQRWLEWRQLPHQVADIGNGPALTFLADVPGDSTGTWFIYYSPSGKAEQRFARRTATAEDWVPPNIGWESGRAGYRAYWGQFDFFGKKTTDLIYDTIANQSYHSEVDFGIDALHVGQTSGLGGLSLYIADKPYAVQNPAGKGNVQFTKRMLTAGPVLAAVSIEAKNIVPDKPDLSVRLLCVSFAERQETFIQAKLSGGDAECHLAPGLVKLPHEQAFVEAERGLCGSWGWQETAIDDIGMAMMASPANVIDVIDLPAERRMRCKVGEQGLLKYWVIGDWRRGRSYPVGPNVTNWRNEVHALADQLQQDVIVVAATAEDVR